MGTAASAHNGTALRGSPRSAEASGGQAVLDAQTGNNAFIRTPTLILGRWSAFLTLRQWPATGETRRLRHCIGRGRLLSDAACAFSHLNSLARYRSCVYGPFRANSVRICSDSCSEASL